MEQNMLNRQVRRVRQDHNVQPLNWGVVYRDTGNGIVGVIVTDGPGKGTRTTWAKSEIQVL